MSSNITTKDIMKEREELLNKEAIIHETWLSRLAKEATSLPISAASLLLHILSIINKTNSTSITMGTYSYRDLCNIEQNSFFCDLELYRSLAFDLSLIKSLISRIDTEDEGKSVKYHVKYEVLSIYLPNWLLIITKVNPFKNFTG